MARILVDRLAVGEFHDAAEIEHHHAMRNLAHDGQVVADEDHRHAEIGLQLHDQVDDLRLDGNVERADGLVADDELGLDDHGARDADALVLAAGEFVRIAVDPAGLQADLLHDLAHARA